MKKILLGIMIATTLSVATPVVSNASSISGYWHTKSLNISISGNHATVNGKNVKLKKVEHNKWKSNHSNSSQPFTLTKSGSNLKFHSGMDNQTLHK